MRSRFGTLHVLLLYTVFAVLVTWPLVLYFNHVVIGDTESDVWKHLWGFWWMRDCVVEQHRLPLYTHLLNYPYGGALFFIDPLGGIMAFPLQFFLTPAQTFNLLVLFNIVFACYGAFVLARYVSKSVPAAFVAGVIYGCSPYLLSNITSGISESYNIGWIPLFMVSYMRALREPSYSNSIKAGVLLGVTTIGCWYYGAFCLVYAVFFFFYHLYVRLRAQGLIKVPDKFAIEGIHPWLRSVIACVAAGAFLYAALSEYEHATVGIFGSFLTALAAIALGVSVMRGQPRRKSTKFKSFFVTFARTTVLQTFVIAVVSGMMVLPVAAVFRSTLNRDVSIVWRDRSRINIDLHLSDRFHNVSRLEDFVTPGKSAAIRTYTVDRLTRVSYVGIIAIVMALMCLITVRRKYIWWWAGVGAVAVLLSLGPFLYVTRDICLSWRFPPYMWMYNWFPFFSQISIPFRFNVMVLLSLGVLSAMVLSRWMRGHSQAFRMLLALSFSLAIIFETMFVSPAPFPVPLASIDAPPVFAELGNDREDAGLLDLPIQLFEGELLPGEYFYYQMLHRKAFPNRVEGEIPRYVQANAFMVSLFHLEHDWPGYPNEDEKSLREALYELRGFKFKYFVVHENLLRAGAAERIHALLSYFLGKPKRYEPNIFVYTVYGATP